MVHLALICSSHVQSCCLCLIQIEFSLTSLKDGFMCLLFLLPRLNSFFSTSLGQRESDPCHVSSLKQQSISSFLLYLTCNYLSRVGGRVWKDSVTYRWVSKISFSSLFISWFPVFFCSSSTTFDGLLTLLTVWPSIALTGPLPPDYFSVFFACGKNPSFPVLKDLSSCLTVFGWNLNNNQKGIYS